METKYMAATDLGGLYEVVVASKDVKPYIGHDWIRGIDPEPQDYEFYAERLAVPVGTPENSVVVIKSPPPGRPGEIYRLFQVRQGELVELTGKTHTSWHLDQTNGHLIYEVGTSRGGTVSPNDWGYCSILEKGWYWGDYEDALCEEAQATGLSKARILNQLLQERQRADRAEPVVTEIAGELTSLDLIGTPPPRRKRRGWLRAIVEGQGTAGECAAHVVLKLRALYEMCRSALPDLPPLADDALDA